MWGDVLFVVSQGFGKLSLVAALAAQSAGSVVQAGTKEFTTKVVLAFTKHVEDVRRESERAWLTFGVIKR
ncbi:hypothetical protein ACFX1Q_021184 [Malus domestica]